MQNADRRSSHQEVSHSTRQKDAALRSGNDEKRTIIEKGADKNALYNVIWKSSASQNASGRTRKPSVEEAAHHRYKIVASHSLNFMPFGTQAEAKRLRSNE